MKWVNSIDAGHELNQQTGRSRGPCSYTLDSFSLFTFFISLNSRLMQSLFLLMRSTQISKTVLSNTMLILRRRQSFFHRCRTNRPPVSVYLRNQRRFEEITRNSAMPGFYTEHLRMSFDSF